MKVEWTDFAKAKISEIAEHHLAVAGSRVAKKIVEKIFDKPRILSLNPKAGQRELLLEDQKVEFRRLVEGNYKIIYHITDNAIRIVDIWDCRQDPQALREDIITDH